MGFNPSQVGYKRLENPTCEPPERSFNPSQVGYKPQLVLPYIDDSHEFQSLTGRLQTIEFQEKLHEVCAFQSLTGRLQTTVID